MTKQSPKERKPHDRHWPDAAKGSYVVHYRKTDTVRKLWYPKLLEALDFVLSHEGAGEIRPEKITQGRSVLWNRKEG